MLLSGILEAPDGTAWHFDDCGYYRLAKGRKLKAERVDQAVLGRLGNDLSSDSTVQLLLLAFEQLASGDDEPVDGRNIAALEKRVAKLTMQIGRTVDLAAAVEDPAPILRRVSDLEHQRAELMAQLDELRARKQRAACAGAIEPDQVRTLLRGLMLEIAKRAEEPDHRAEARQALGEVLERVVLDPDLHTVRLHYAVATGVNLASPRGFEPL